MKAYWVLFLIIPLLLASCKKDELTENVYVGYYHPTERIRLEFKTDSRVAGRISSTDFVGRFHDNSYGHYDYKFPHINISWDRTALGNQVYKSPPVNPDSIVINATLDTLVLYEGGEAYELQKSQTTKGEMIRDDVMVFLFNNFFLFTLVFLALLIFVIYRAIKWYHDTNG